MEEQNFPNTNLNWNPDGNFIRSYYPINDLYSRRINEFLGKGVNKSLRNILTHNITGLILTAEFSEALMIRTIYTNSLVNRSGY